MTRKNSETSTNRRGFLRSAGTTLIGGGVAAKLAERNIVRPIKAAEKDVSFEVESEKSPGTVFPQSVGSGGPTPNGVILWTRVNPKVKSGKNLGLEVAEDKEFDRTIFRTEIDSKNITEEHDYVVKIDLDGHLESDTRYFYRFVYDGVSSKTGRCKTLPSPDSNPDEVSFGVVTCQDYQNGYYGAYHHISEEDIDFLVHLGDFIYESSNGQYVSPTDDVKDGRDFELPSGSGLAESLDDFRHLYKTYKSDPFLQEGLENHTLIAGWDDHEIGNNRYWDYVDDAPVIPEKEKGDNPEFAVELTANGIQAWVEYMPARVEYDPSKDDLHEQFRLWRNMEFGDLVNLSVTDERLYRNGPPCEDWQRVSCTGEEDEDRTILGDEQKKWFKSWVKGSDAKWTTWANEVLTMPLTAGDGWNQVEFILDSWDGFQHERWELMESVHDVDPRNFVTLTGDLHCSMAGYMKEGYGEIEWEWNYDRVGVELMTPSITSVNAADVIDFPGSWDGEALGEIAKNQNEHIEYIDWYKHGYSVVEFGRDECRYKVYEVDKETNSRNAEKKKLAEYRIPDGETKLEKVYTQSVETTVQ